MYARRVIDNELDELQPHLPAVSIFGPKAVGKTETARQRVKSALWLDSPEDVQRLRADPGLLGTLPGPVLLDEWQRVPEVWDSLRRQVDAGAPAGRFVLTGSSAPRDLPVHSGAGRIAGLRMRPMTLAERGVGQGAVSLKKLLAGDAEISGETEVDLGVYVREIVSSGFPGIRSKGTPRLIRAQLDSYIDAIVQREFA
ncbi:MAG: AAA family ATPase, partial [Bifidobacteriaceae bacterium]|nr:AAA family ATPase [Bifidobacteriaceae bacterium]